MLTNRTVLSYHVAIDQQASLSQLASLAGVQNDATQQQQQVQQPQQQHEQQLQQPIDQPSTETAMGIEMGNENLGNTVLNDSSGGTNTSF